MNLQQIIDFYNNNQTLCYVVGFFLLCIIDGKLPSNSKYKIVSKAIKGFGSLLMADVKKEIESTNRRIDMNHEETKKMVGETKKEIKKINDERMLDTQTILRDRITQLYNNSRKKQYILDKDKENYDYLFTRYTLNNGNSYVQNTINPFMQSLPTFMSDDDADDWYKEHGTYKSN